MSPIPRVHRQAFGNLLLLCLLCLTLLFQTPHTSSKSLSTTGTPSLLLLIVFTTATYVAENDLTSYSALVLVSEWCTSALHYNTFAPCSLVDHAYDRLVDLYTFVCAEARTSITSTQKIVDFTVEFLIYLCSTYLIKSGPELLYQRLLSLEGSLSTSTLDLFNLSSSFSTSDETISEAAPEHADVDRTTIPIGSTCVPKSGRASQGDALQNSSSDCAAIPNASLPAKSSVAFPRLPNPSADGDCTDHIGPDVFAEVTAFPKRTRKIAQQRSEFITVASLRQSFAAVVPPRTSGSPFPTIIINEDLSASSFASFGSPSFTASTTAASSSPTSSTCKTTPATLYSSQPNLRCKFEPENSSDPEDFTNVTATVPNIVVTEDPQDRSFSSAQSPSSTTITALVSHSTLTSQTAPLTPRSDSTLDADSDVAGKATDDPARSASLLLTPPQAAIANGKFQNMAYGSSSFNASSTAFSYAFSNSASTLQTPTTTPYSTLLQLPSDVERKTNLTNSPLPPPGTPRIKSRCLTVIQRLWASLHPSIPRRKRSTSRTIDTTSAAGQTCLNLRRTESEKHWHWAKTEGKLPEGGRRIWRRSNLQLAAPTSMPPAIHNGPLCSMTPAMATPPTPLHVVLRGPKGDEVDEHGFSEAELAQAMADSRQGASLVKTTGDGGSSRLSVSTASTLVETDDEGDDVDKQGFSKRDQRKAMAESSRAARARPFYGASTSSAGNQPLSQEEWDMLEQYVAAPSNPKTVVRPPSPASTHVNTEVEMVAPSSLAPPPSLPEATAPIKTKELPRLRKFVKKIVPLNPFKTRSRAHAAH